MAHLIREVYSDLLFLSDAITARDLKLLYDRQIAAVVDLAANERPASLGRDIIYCRFPLHDDGSNHDDLLSSAIDCLHLLLRRRFRTLVTCSAGMSRSPLVAAAALSLLTADPLPDCLRLATIGAPHDVSPALHSAIVRTHAKLAGL